MDGKYDNYIKAERNIYVNPKFIRWIQQIDECYNICSKSTGCTLDDTHTKFARLIIHQVIIK